MFTCTNSRFHCAHHRFTHAQSSRHPWCHYDVTIKYVVSSSHAVILTSSQNHHHRCRHTDVITFNVGSYFVRSPTHLVRDHAPSWRSMMTELSASKRVLLLTQLISDNWHRSLNRTSPVMGENAVGRLQWGEEAQGGWAQRVTLLWALPTNMVRPCHQQPDGLVGLSASSNIELQLQYSIAN